MRLVLIIAALLAVPPVLAQEAGWHYSPLPGEGDRAALGCASGSNGTGYACIAVRCEEDFSVGFHLYTSRAEGDVGRWLIDIDEQQEEFAAEAENGPYNGVLTGDTAWLRSSLEQGAVAYLQPQGGKPLQLGVIPLGGSLKAITQALAFCAPRVPKAEPNADPGVEEKTIKEN